MPSVLVAPTGRARRGRVRSSGARARWIGGLLVLATVVSAIAVCCCAVGLLPGPVPGVTSAAARVTTGVAAFGAEHRVADVSGQVADADHSASDCDTGSHLLPAVPSSRDGVGVPTAAAVLPSPSPVTMPSSSAVVAVDVIRTPHLLCVLRT